MNFFYYYGMKILFSERLKQLRKENKMTQAELADAIKTTQRRVSYMESGKIEPDLEMLVALSLFFDVSIDYLVGTKDY